MQKIKDNKVAPMAIPRNMVPAYAILGVSLTALFTTESWLQELPVQTKAILIGIVIVMAISHEIYQMQLKSAYKQALANMAKGLESTPLPKKFALKLTAEMETTPAEFADALADP